MMRDRVHSRHPRAQRCRGARDRTRRYHRHVPLSIPKAAGTTTDIEVKEVLVRPWDGKGKSRRYVVCHSPERAAWEAAQRTAIIEALQEQLSRGDKSLVGNSGFRKFLKVVGDDHFALDEAKVAE